MNPQNNTHTIIKNTNQNQHTDAKIHTTLKNLKFKFMGIKFGFSILTTLFIVFFSNASASPTTSLTRSSLDIKPLIAPISPVVQKQVKPEHLKSAIRNFVKKHFVQKKKDRNPSKTAMILGILALASIFIPWYTILLAIPLGIAAIITGSNARSTNEKDRKKAKAGVILGIVSLSLFALILILGVILFIGMLQMFSWGG